MSPVPITRNGGPVPYQYTLATGEAFESLAITAHWNGASAAGSFIPTVSFYTQDGKLIARCPAGGTVSAGDDAEATFAPFPEARGLGTLAWGRLQGATAPQAISGNPATGNPTLIDFTGGGFSEDGSGTFFFDAATPQFMQCRVAPLPGMWFVQAHLYHQTVSSPFPNPALVRSYLRFVAPVGTSDAPLASETTMGRDDSDPNSVVDNPAWGLTGIQPNNAQTPPAGFGILIQNFDAAVTTVQSTNPLLFVTLVGA